MNRNRPTTLADALLADPDTESSDDIRRAINETQRGGRGSGSSILICIGSGCDDVGNTNSKDEWSSSSSSSRRKSNESAVSCDRDSDSDRDDNHEDARGDNNNGNGNGSATTAGSKPKLVVDEPPPSNNGPMIIQKQTSTQQPTTMMMMRRRMPSSSRCAADDYDIDDDDESRTLGGAFSKDDCNTVERTKSTLTEKDDDAKKKLDNSPMVKAKDPKTVESTSLHARSPARRLPGTSSDRLLARRLQSRLQSQNSFQGILKYVIQDAEADNLSESSEGEKGQRLQQRMLPVRRLSRNSCTRGGSFRGSLMNVLEDNEADMDDANTYEETLVDTAGKLSLSSASCKSGSYNESVNIMDFGHSRGIFTESMLSLGDESTKGSLRESLSNLVDSDGFLPWGNDIGSTTSGLLRNNERGPSKRRGSFADSALSKLVDSQGFLGWESQMDDLLEAIEDETDNGNNDHYADQDNRNNNNDAESSKNLHESWHIEDYENANDTTTDGPDESPRRSLSEKMKVFSTKVTEGISAKGSSRSINTDNDAHQQEAVKTNVIKRILLRGHSMDEPMPRQNSRSASFKSFFISRRNSENASSIPSSSDHDNMNGDCFDSRPAIRVNREDGIDIGELRRQLLHEAAENNEGKDNDGVSRRQMSWF